MTTYLTTYRSGAHGDKSARERVLTTFVYQKGLNGAEMSRKWLNFTIWVVEAASSSLVTQTKQDSVEPKGTTEPCFFIVFLKC